jgi:hypothetical protein
MVLDGLLTVLYRHCLPSNPSTRVRWLHAYLCPSPLIQGSCFLPLVEARGVKCGVLCSVQCSVCKCAVQCRGIVLPASHLSVLYTTTMLCAAGNFLRPQSPPRSWFHLALTLEVRAMCLCLCVCVCGCCVCACDCLCTCNVWCARDCYVCACAFVYACAVVPCCRPFCHSTWCHVADQW